MGEVADRYRRLSQAFADKIASVPQDAWSRPTPYATFEAAVGQFLFMDLVVHGWDLARSAGLDEEMDPEDVTRVHAQAVAMGERLRSPQAFGPALPEPANASPQENLLAFLGRQP